ncbi:ADP-glyceromanno-heptose 6-epimerase [Lichenifustis flavocetrariae]|uniref:ADP-L-glycero-D-manno-heptose-6-epimerase n=1 Tax=Lichenifustis flavocetrariae TaxID=2949735 RepID=A0AA42CKL3_9HYPH|nr:ADP-glyceromanno-heptose 6-epimerase [Lichenifustis flavocetrariae]MCW6509391.1 ADP-glyceromanno-heptose 6-epimerase [Lichenifustis flavocetrariae]
MILVTGGAGFIGSNVVASLNHVGERDVVVCDDLGTGNKWRNLQKALVQDIVPIKELHGWIEGRTLQTVVHMGANSSTTASDGDGIMEENFRFSLRLLEWCTMKRVPFIYASSAATYGAGEAGFVDDISVAALRQLRPLNLYGWSKHLFDLVVADKIERKLPLPPVCVGLKFFNVYGPNELHKGSMMSLVSKLHDRAAAGEKIALFKSHKEGYADGEQLRDFVHVDDLVDVIRWLMKSGPRAGIFNVGTGEARSFKDLIQALFTAVGRTPDIEYVDMPDAIRDRYQYYTQADLNRLRAAGYNQPFLSVEQGVDRLVSQYLSKPDPYR